MKNKLWKPSCMSVGHHLCDYASMLSALASHGAGHSNLEAWEEVKSPVQTPCAKGPASAYLGRYGDVRHVSPQPHDHTCTPGNAPCESGICLLQDKVVLLERMDEWPLRVKLASVGKILVKIQYDDQR